MLPVAAAGGTRAPAGVDAPAGVATTAIIARAARAPRVSRNERLGVAVGATEPARPASLENGMGDRGGVDTGGHASWNEHADHRVPGGGVVPGDPRGGDHGSDAGEGGRVVRRVDR